jgi:uncharacterized protein (DUF302 family)
MAAEKNGGLINIPSNHSVDETVEKLKTILQPKRITLFALIDHSGEASEGRNENATDQAAAFRKSKGRHAGDAGRSKQCD